MAVSIAWVLSKLRFPLAVALGGTGKDTTAGLLTDLKAAGAYAKDNVVGPVSQASGVPTGAIIESGSNANGRYIKYADGTMICTRKDTYTGQNIAGAYGSMFNGQAVPAVNYSQAFIATPVTSQTMTAEGAVCIAGSNGTASATGWPAIFPLAAISYTGAAIIVDRIAIGRWY